MTFFFTQYVSLSFHPLFHSPGISAWSICIGACHACTASQCDLRGILGFGIATFLLWHQSAHPVLFLVFLLLFPTDGLLGTWHTSCLVTPLFTAACYDASIPLISSWCLVFVVFCLLVFVACVCSCFAVCGCWLAFF